MSYLQRSDRKNKRGRFLKNVFFIFIVLVIISFIFPSFGSSFSRKALYPFWVAKERILGGDTFQSVIRSKKALVAENENLKDIITRQKVQILTAEEVRQENEELREILNNLAEKEAVTARILARPPISAYDTFVVDAGTLAGIEVGDEVVAFGEVQIGEVTEVEEKSSLVRLHSAPGNSFQSYSSKTSEAIELRGRGAGNFSAEIPKGVNVSVGDKLFLEGGIEILGTVEEIESKDSDSFKTLFIKSPINIFKLKRVEILL